jgi:hypothetical protein
MFLHRAAITLAAALAWLEFSSVARAATVSAYWDDVAFNYVQQTNSAPVAARMLAIMHAAMYDAWTAYDPIAAPKRANGILKRPPEEITDSNRIEAISFAAHKALVDLFPSMAASIDDALTQLGYDLEDANSGDTSTPAGIGNVAADAVVALRYCGNQLGDGPNPSNPYGHYSLVNNSDSSDNPSSWRPLRTFDGDPVVQQASAESVNQ